MVDNRIIHILKENRRNIRQEIKDLTKKLNDVERMLEIAENSSSSTRRPLSSPRRTRIATTRSEGRLSKKESTDLLMEFIRESSHPVNRNEMARALGYESANGTISEGLRMLMRKGLVERCGRDSTNRDTFKAI
jgi:DNA-binding transcriptional regulator GbsR (MarR family)